jgi:hypothetical protein
MAVRAAPGHIGLTQEIIDHLGGATGSLGYLWSRCTILVAFDDFFVAQGQQKRAQRSSARMSSVGMVFGCLAFVLAIFYLLGRL